MSSFSLDISNRMREPTTDNLSWVYASFVSKMRPVQVSQPRTLSTARTNSIGCKNFLVVTTRMTLMNLLLLPKNSDSLLLFEI